MFERFTDRARRVVVLAQENARLLGHDYLGTEHVLIGLAQEGEGVAAQVLAQLGFKVDDLKALVLAEVPAGAPPVGHIPFTPECKKAIELSLREALQLGHNYIGTEHVLLGLLREGEGLAARLIIEHGIGLNDVRRAVINNLSGYQGPKSEPPPEPAGPDPYGDYLRRQLEVELSRPRTRADFLRRQLVARGDA